MDLQIQPSAQEMPIREKRMALAGREGCYRLFERGSRFFIEITLGADRSSADVGSSFYRAAYLYDLLVEGEVTPCTLQDILEDFALA